MKRKEDLTSWGLHDELVKSKALSAGLGNSGTGSLCETESSNCKLWNLDDSLIVSDSADNNGDSVSKESALTF
jgi:hypothetical protein